MCVSEVTIGKMRRRDAGESKIIIGSQAANHVLVVRHPNNTKQKLPVMKAVPFLKYSFISNTISQTLRRLPTPSQRTETFRTVPTHLPALSQKSNTITRSFRQVTTPRQTQINHARLQHAKLTRFRIFHHVDSHHRVSRPRRGHSLNSRRARTARELRSLWAHRLHA